MPTNVRSLMKPGDLHIVVDASDELMTCFGLEGKQWFCKARTIGQYADWKVKNGDTPRGVYEVSFIYDTQGEAAYGRWCIDLYDLDGQERKHGRDGISIHGGGSASPTPFAARQGWYPTHGCIRVQNHDLETLIEPTFRKAMKGKHKVFVTVQD